MLTADRHESQQMRRCLCVGGDLAAKGSELIGALGDCKIMWKHWRFWRLQNYVETVVNKTQNTQYILFGLATM